MYHSPPGKKVCLHLTLQHSPWNWKSWHLGDYLLIMCLHHQDALQQFLKSLWFSSRYANILLSKQPKKKPFQMKENLIINSTSTLMFDITSSNFLGSVQPSWKYSATAMLWITCTIKGSVRGMANLVFKSIMALTNNVLLAKCTFSAPEQWGRL